MSDYRLEDIDAAIQLRPRARKLLKVFDEASGKNGLDSEKQDTLVEELKLSYLELDLQNEELRRVQSELLATQMQHYRHVELAPVGLLVLDEKGIIQKANLRATDLLKECRPHLGVLQLPFLAYLQGEGASVLFRHLKDVFSDSQSKACQLTLSRDRDPESRPALCVRMTSVAHDAPGGGRICLSILTDITALVRQEKELEAMARSTAEENQSLTSDRDWHRLLFHESPLPQFALLPGPVWRSVNPALAVVWGYRDPAAFIASPPSWSSGDFVHPTEANVLLRWQGDPGQMQGVRYWMQRPDGTRQEVVLHIRFLAAEGDRPPLAIGTLVADGT